MKWERKKKNIFGLGNYEVKSTSSNEINIRIFGFLRVDTRIEHVEMDCNGCGHDCNLNKDRNTEVLNSNVFALTTLFLIPAGHTWYRVVQLNPDKGFWGNKIEIRHNLIKVSAERAKEFNFTEK